MKRMRLKKGQLVSFKPRMGLLRRDADILKVYNAKGIKGAFVEISLLASPSEISMKRSFTHK
jgi:hypothetical protein